MFFGRQSRTAVTRQQVGIRFQSVSCKLCHHNNDNPFSLQVDCVQGGSRGSDSFPTTRRQIYLCTSYLVSAFESFLPHRSGSGCEMPPMLAMPDCLFLFVKVGKFPCGLATRNFALFFGANLVTDVCQTKANECGSIFAHSQINQCPRSPRQGVWDFAQQCILLLHWQTPKTSSEKGKTRFTPRGFY